ncbi:MAG: HemK family protein methyltransferase, partial [Desulfobaccales bacterium]
LIPRPDTEVLVEAVLDVFRGGGQGLPQAGKPVPPAPTLSPETPPPTPSPGSTGIQPVQHRQDACAPGQGNLALDVGAGSGAVVLALARELLELIWVAVDISAAALEVARENARRHGVAERVSFLQGNLFSGIRRHPVFILITANLPYVPRQEWEQLSKEIRDYEPMAALLGGEDGLALLKPLSQQAHSYLRPGGWLALEVGAGQAKRGMEFLEETKAYDALKAVNDYQGIARVVLARRSGKS